jgi:hypothetical protein
MAVSQGVGPHFVIFSCSGGSFQVEHGMCVQKRNRQNGHYSVAIPMFADGALQALANLGGDDNDGTITVTSHGITGTLMTGPITAIDFDYLGTVIHVIGTDKMVKLHNEKTAEKFQNQKGSDIAQKLASRAGLGSGNIDGSKLMAGKKLEKDFVKLTDNVGLSTAIHTLAQFDGARYWVDKDGNFHYQSQDQEGGSGSSYSVNYKPPFPGSPMVSDALGLRVRLNVFANGGADVTVKSWHPKDKKSYIGRGTTSGSGNPMKYSYHIPGLDQAHADQHAKSRAKEHARHAVQVIADVVGDPSIDPDGSLTLSGTAHDGTYQIDEVRHEFGMSGHTMSIAAKSPGQGSSESNVPGGFFF